MKEAKESHKAIVKCNSSFLSAWQTPNCIHNLIDAQGFTGETQTLPTSAAILNGTHHVIYTNIIGIRQDQQAHYVITIILSMHTML